MPTKSSRKTKDYVRKLIPRTAIIWVPGEGLPDQLKKLVEDKVEHYMIEYDKIQTQRLRDYKAPPPDTVEKAVTAMFGNLQGLRKDDWVVAAGLFIQEFKKRIEGELNLAEKALDISSDMVNGCNDRNLKLSAILRGEFSVLLPPKIMTNAGESVVSKSASGGTNTKATKN